MTGYLVLRTSRPRGGAWPAKIFSTGFLTLIGGVWAFCFSLSAAPYFEIQVVDGKTGRGVPCVELETVNHAKYLTDSVGRIAYQEPGHEGQTVFFFTRSHGYDFVKDGFGMTGVRLTIRADGKEVIQAKRVNLAERLYRLTGEGIYRDSILLGHPTPMDQPLLNARVVGQDSIQRVIVGGKIHWYWGDTLPLSYPLGNFRMSGAVSDLHSDPATAINYQYFSQPDGFTKGMFPLEPKGDLIWADGFLVLTSQMGEEQVIAHFQRLKGLGKPLGRGLAIYDKAREEFTLLKNLPLAESWRFPHGHPVRQKDQFLFGINFPNVRVPATRESISDETAYEAWSCLPDGGTLESKSIVPYRWTRLAPPTGPKEEKTLIEAGVMPPDKAHFQPRDVETGKTVQMHSGTVNWNEWRKKWILIAVEIGGTSMLGEVWYSEAEEPTGPWKAAWKIVTHDKYSFYNPAHHPFFDQEGGRVIFFEGTYTAEFSGSHQFTPRYDYNQIMYRLDLANVDLEKTIRFPTE